MSFKMHNAWWFLNCGHRQTQPHGALRVNILSVFMELDAEKLWIGAGACPQWCFHPNVSSAAGRNKLLIM